MWMPSAVVPDWMSATSLRRARSKCSSARDRCDLASTQACTSALRVEPCEVRAM
jgi:hypothetical protein